MGVKRFFVEIVSGEKFGPSGHNLKYLVIDVMSNGNSRGWSSFEGAQFKTKKEAKDWIRDNVPRNEQHWWAIYTPVEVYKK